MPALTALVLLAVAHYFYPHPEELETATVFPQSTGLQRTYWIYEFTIGRSSFAREAEKSSRKLVLA